jgi:hypothetical protein
MKYFIYCMNFLKCHNVPLLSPTIKKNPFQYIWHVLHSQPWIHCGIRGLSYFSLIFLFYFTLSVWWHHHFAKDWPYLSSSEYAEVIGMKYIDPAALNQSFLLNIFKGTCQILFITCYYKLFTFIIGCPSSSSIDLGTLEVKDPFLKCLILKISIKYTHKQFGKWMNKEVIDRCSILITTFKFTHYFQSKFKILYWL